MNPTPPPRARNPLVVVLAVSAGLFALFLVISGLAFTLRSPAKGKGGAPALFSSSGSVGVVELNGVIMDSRKVLRKLERMEEDSQIRAVVLRLNSPGGSVAPSQEIYEAVKAYKKPIVSSMSSVAASGAYYVACGTRKIFANAGTLTGSIGVIMEFANLEKLYDWARIKRFSIKTGKYKDAGAEFREMTADERALLQSLVDDVLAQFKGAVREGRKLDAAAVDRVADGRIFSGSQAKAAKLVDEIGTLQDAVVEAAKLAGIKGEPDVVYPERRSRRWLEYLLEDAGRDEADGESAVARLLSGILGLPVPSLPSLPAGVYWLWTGGR
jgi:protease IV